MIHQRQSPNLLKLILALLLFYLNNHPLFAQVNTKRSLIIAAINSKGELYIDRNPIPRIEFDERVTWRNLADSVKRRLGKARLLQLFNHSQIRDTTYWTNEELDKSILVNSRSANVNVDEVISKFHLTDEQQINTYRNKISRFNSTDFQGRNIYYFSRPIFDDSGKFALIKWDNAHNWLGGGGAIELYQLIGDEWHYLGWISIWRY